FLAEQRPIGIEQRHLADVSLFVVLVDFLTGQRGAGNREILVLDLVALEVVLDNLDDLMFAFLFGAVSGQELGNLRAHAPNRADQAVPRAVAFDHWGGGRGTTS